ncbi:hypothetical protein MMC31_003182 [Peltigera leucophlebia]|nr:hypothetical protein [Peltigera leucophlebia]
MKPFLTAILCFVGLVREVAAQSLTTSSIRPAKTIPVTVGLLNDRFDPEIIQAEVNDTIHFKFYPTGHGVARAEWHHPCVPYELSGRNKVGFYSGLRPVDVVLADPPTWDLLINSTEPIFFYCTAEGSCLKEGMIGVINPNASTSLQTQRSEALASSYMVVPGGKIPDEGGTTTSSSSRVLSTSLSSTFQAQTSTATPTGTAASSSQTAVPAESHNKLSSGAIAGIAVGGAFIAIMLGALLFLLGRQTTMLQFMRRQQNPPPMVYPVGSPVTYYEPNTPMTQNPYAAPYAHPKYGTRGNAVELGSNGTTIQPPGSPTHDGSREHSVYSDQFDEYRRQNATGSPPPPPMASHLESPR